MRRNNHVKLVMTVDDIRLFNGIEGEICYDNAKIINRELLHKMVTIFDEVGGIVYSGPVYEVMILCSKESKEKLQEWQGQIDIFSEQDDCHVMWG